MEAGVWERPGSAGRLADAWGFAFILASGGRLWLFPFMAAEAMNRGNREMRGRGIPRAPEHELKERYALLWRGAITRIRSGAIEIDPVLAEKQTDLRRGLTVIIRPGLAVRRRVAALLEDLRAIEPDQYYYDPAEFHVTFLSLFTATVEHVRFFARSREYEAAVDCALAEVRPFKIRFSGITASPGAVMVQGFPESEALNAGRERLRRELRARGLTEGLDERYRLETAHITVVRFRRRLGDAERFARALERWRAAELGATEVESPRLVRNDWYMSRGNLELVRGWKLGEAGVKSPPSRSQSRKTTPRA